MMTRGTLLTTCLALALGAVQQAPPQQADSQKNLPQFEVASIKPNKSGDRRVMIGVQPGGRFNASNVTLKMLIRNAYQLQDFQLVGGPDWMSDDHYDIVAKAEDVGDGKDPFRSETPGTPSRGQLMIRSLLAERFKLAVHNENRELPIYALVLARSDGKLGPQLQKAATECGAGPLPRPGAGGAPGAPASGGPPPSGPPKDPAAAAAGGRMGCGIRTAPGNMNVNGGTMSQFVGMLAMFVGRVVVDKTGLTGGYDFNLTWTPDQMSGPAGGGPGGPGGAPGPMGERGPSIDPNGPSIFTAVQEQLGLKLDSQKGPVSVLVIDHVEHPVED